MLTQGYSDLTENFRPAEFLWHYTGFRGLEGILNGSLWASSAFFLNDTQEFRYAVDIALAVLEEERATYPGAFDEAAVSLIQFFQGIDGKSSFVASFSKKGDDLSQWRAYGGSGPSFAIGFDPRELSAKAKESRFDLVRVAYGRTIVEEAFRADLQRHRENFLAAEDAQAIDPESASPDLNAQTSMGFEVIASLMRLTEQCKHETFKGEEEWRLVRRIPVIAPFPRPPLRFRAAGSLVVPYVEIPLHSPLEKAPTAATGLPPHTETPIMAINIGPSPHPEALEYAVREMAARKGIAAEVKRSATPFRNW